MKVVVGDDLVLVDQLARERRADEAGAAGDEDPLPRQHRAKPSARRDRPGAEGTLELMRSALAPSSLPTCANGSLQWLEAGPRSSTRVWRRVLRRRIEPDERAATEARLAGGMSRASLLRSSRTSAEYEQLAPTWTTASPGRPLQRARRRAPAQASTAPPGSDERPIEMPWCLSRYARRAPRARRRLRVRRACVPRRAARSRRARADRRRPRAGRGARAGAGVQADLRDLPFEDGAFDFAIAISTLEHVGRDNTQYGLAAEGSDSLACGAARAVPGVRSAWSSPVPTGAGELLPRAGRPCAGRLDRRFERAGRRRLGGRARTSSATTAGARFRRCRRDCATASAGRALRRCCARSSGRSRSRRPCGSQ